MAKANYPTARAFVWQRGFDSPLDGYHVHPGDPGEGTFGGVIEATWANAVSAGIVHGLLKNATTELLSDVLEVKFWGNDCELLPPGLDLVLFNGRMMSGRFPKLLQQCLGYMGDDDVDGWIGPKSIALIATREPETLIDAVCGVHYAYLTTLKNWADSQHGWTTRLKAVQRAAIAMCHAGIMA